MPSAIAPLETTTNEALSCAAIAVASESKAGVPGERARADLHDHPPRVATAVGDRASQT